MIKEIKVVNNAGMPVEDLHFQINGSSFVSDRLGKTTLEGNPKSTVKINYVGSPEIQAVFSDLKSTITVDNGFKKNTCKNKGYISKEIRLINESGEPLSNVEVFSESGLTNTTTDAQGFALVKVNDPEEYINFDSSNIEGQAIMFRSLSDETMFKNTTGEITAPATSNASAWFWGLLGLGLLWNHSQNKNISKSKGLKKPVKITL
jgi:hypothetical protein